MSNASGARISDATATGTIQNADPMPQAWGDAPELHGLGDHASGQCGGVLQGGVIEVGVNGPGRTALVTEQPTDSG